MGAEVIGAVLGVLVFSWWRARRRHGKQEDKRAAPGDSTERAQFPRWPR